MRKRDEVSDPKSCLNKAKDDQVIFVVIDSDPAFVETLRFWAAERIRLGINQAKDAKIVSALASAYEVEEFQARREAGQS